MKLKKLVVCAMASVMVVASTMTAFAAELSNSEKKIVDALKSAGVASEYVTQAENYLKGDDVDVTDAQATTIVTQIEEAKEIAGDVKDIAKLSADQKSKIVKKIEAAANEVGLTVSVDTSKDSIVVKDAAGKVVAEATTKTVKDTGANMTVTVSVVSLLALALAGCAVAGKKFATR